MSGRQKNKAIALANIIQRAKRSRNSDKNASGHGICAEVDEILKTVNQCFPFVFQTCDSIFYILDGNFT